MQHGTGDALVEERLLQASGVVSKYQRCSPLFYLQQVYQYLKLSDGLLRHVNLMLDAVRACRITLAERDARLQAAS